MPQHHFDPNLVVSTMLRGSTTHYLPELMGSLELGNVLVFVQLIDGQMQAKKSAVKNPNIA